MTTDNLIPESFETEPGPIEYPFIPVDTASVLIVDPCHLDPDVVTDLVQRRIAVLIGTDSDGVYPVNVEQPTDEEVGVIEILALPASGLHVIYPGEVARRMADYDRDPLDDLDDGWR